MGIDRDDTIIVACYTGARGALVTEFLRGLGFTNTYFFDGGVIQAAKNPNFPYEGYTTLGSPDNINRLLDTGEVREMINDGFVPIDIRSTESFEKNALPESIHFSRDVMLRSEIQDRLGTLDKNTRYFAVCDSWLNCYSAKILGFEMGDKGLTFVGSFPKPYEY